MNKKVALLLPFIIRLGTVHSELLFVKVWQEI